MMETVMMENVMVPAIAAVMLAIAIAVRLILCRKQENQEHHDDTPGAGISQTNGRKEIQADVVLAFTNDAGTMAVLADGIGNQNTGKLCAQLAADTVMDRYESYHVLNNPDYFFKSTFAEANRRIQMTIGERRGGASLAAVFVDKRHLYYAVAGNVRVALKRGKELIPLSRGQTMDVLAAEAYENGAISRQEAIWSMDEKRVWNHLGMDGFREIELCEHPIQLKRNDTVFVASKGIFEELSWGEMEDILLSGVSVKEQADTMVRKAESKSNPEMDNGSVLLLKVQTEAADEKDKLGI